MAIAQVQHAASTSAERILLLFNSISSKILLQVNTFFSHAVVRMLSVGVTEIRIFRRRTKTQQMSNKSIKNSLPSWQQASPTQHGRALQLPLAR